MSLTLSFSVYSPLLLIATICIYILYFTNPIHCCTPHCLQDNPAAKIIFTVRNPIERLYSSYKYYYHSTFSAHGSFDEFFLPTIQYRSKFSEIREMIINKTEITEIIDYYYNTNNNMSSVDNISERTELWLQSIYILPILYYQSVFGKANVLVVSAEDMDVHNPVRMVDTLNDVFNFIGECVVVMEFDVYVVYDYVYIYIVCM